MQSNNRQSHRLQYYDYSREGIYFITICTRNRQCLFGKVSEGSMMLNDIGKVAEKCWNDIPKHFPHSERANIIRPYGSVVHRKQLAQRFVVLK